jgi:hypothetical protein
VKPIPIIIIIYILAQAYDKHHSDSDLAIADMIVIAFFFLLRPGEDTCTTNDDSPFHLEDVHLYIVIIKLYSNTASLAELDAFSSVSYKFTTQKKGIRDDKTGARSQRQRALLPRQSHSPPDQTPSTAQVQTKCADCIILSHQSAHCHQT